MITRKAELRRTAALAYWRYAHDYLRVAQELYSKHEVSYAEAQPVYHLAAQAQEFALKAFLRARAVPPEALTEHYAFALDAAFDEARARGLPSPPPLVLGAVRSLAAHHRPEGFVRLDPASAASTDAGLFFDAVRWLLDAIVPIVAEDYATYYSDEASPSKESFMLRLRADLSATAREEATL
ncbi:MAG TPA: hypothetical protein VFC24_02730 [Casimicrobiaceae bacterium]|nr:hypothetical protein [Casimicrobiaceae bacterium]